MRQNAEANTEIKAKNNEMIELYKLSNELMKTELEWLKEVRIPELTSQTKPSNNTDLDNLTKTNQMLTEKVQELTNELQEFDRNHSAELQEFERNYCADLVDR